MGVEVLPKGSFQDGIEVCNINTRPYHTPFFLIHRGGVPPAAGSSKLLLVKPKPRLPDSET